MKRVETRVEMLAMPLVSMAVDQRWWNNLIQRGLYGYHQNSRGDIADIKNILQNGLIPWNQSNRTPYNRSIGEPRTDHVYIRVGNPQEVDTTFCQFKIDLRQLDPSKIDLDEDALNPSLVRKMNVEGIDQIPEHLKPHPGGMFNHLQELQPGQQSLGEYAESQSEIIDQPRVVQEGISNINTFAYRGIVPPKAISLNKNFIDYKILIESLNQNVA